MSQCVSCPQSDSSGICERASVVRLVGVGRGKAVISLEGPALAFIVMDKKRGRHLSIRHRQLSRRAR